MPAIHFYLFWIEFWVSNNSDLLLNLKFIIKMHFFLPRASFLPTLAQSTAVPFLVLHSRIWEQSVKSYPRKHVISFPPFSNVSRENIETKRKSLLCQGSTITIFSILPISCIFPSILLLQVFFSSYQPTNSQICPHPFFSSLLQTYFPLLFLPLSKRKYPCGLSFVSWKIFTAQCSPWYVLHLLFFPDVIFLW